MRIPVLSGLRELDVAPRRFLFFIVFNVISWQCIVGPAMVLFGRKIGMPPSWVGYLNAFMPLSMLLVVVTGHLVRNLGAKRLMFSAWLMRNLISCTVFLLPWAMGHWGQRAGWYVLLVSTLGFCLMRAIGGGGWFPWLHEVVPEKQRGAYFSSETTVTQLLNVLAMLAQAIVLNGDPEVWRFLTVYGIGIASGLISLIWMGRVPGGRPVAESTSFNDTIASYRGVLADKPFCWYVIVASCCFSSTSWLGSASVLYMRDVLGVSARHITLLTALGSVGVMLTIHYWRRYAENTGSGAALLATLSCHGVTALGFVALLPGAAFTPYLLTVLCTLASIFGAAYWMAVHRAMLGYVKASDRVGYSNVWTVVTSLAFGVTPIAAGYIIDHWHLAGFRTCFVISAVSGVLCGFTIRRVLAHGHPFGPRVAEPLQTPE